MKRVVLYIFISIFTLFLLRTTPSAIFAQETSSDTGWVDTGYSESMEAADGGDVNAAAHVSNVNTNNYSDFIRRVLGPVEGVTISSEQMGTPYAERMFEQSAMSGLTTYMYAMYTTPPASTYAFVQDMGQTLGFIPKQAYAQGIGFSGLSSLLPIWKVFRNISYSILALVMVVIGFMVMFRKKIDPKTVVTVQNALPKVVITLILITFSYAIVGILIDLMYVVLYVALQLIVNAAPSGMFATDHIAKFTSSNFGAVWRGVFAGYASLPELIDIIFPGPSDWMAKLGAFVGLTFGIGGIISLLVMLIMAIALLFGVVRIFFMLLSAYIQIIVSVLTGPIQILLDAVPGGQGFSSWIKNLISNLVVFPITSIMLTLAWFLIKSSGQTWTPPLLGSGSESISLLIGLGFLFIIPSTVKGLQEALKAKPMVNAGLGAIAGPVGAGFGQGMQLVYQGAMIKGSFARKPDTTALQGQQEAGAGTHK